MPDKFEEEVQQTLNALRLAPSVPVWDKIALRIRPEKRRRRRFIFWWVGAGVLLMAGGWLAYNQLQTSATGVVQQVTTGSADASGANKELATVKEIAPDVPAAQPPIQHQKSAEKSVAKKGNVVRYHQVSLPLAPLKKIPVISHVKEESDEPVIESHPDISIHESKVEKKGLPQEGIASPDTKAITKPIEKALVSSHLKSDTTTVDLAKETKPNALAPTPEPAAPIIDSLLKKKVAKTSDWKKAIGLTAGRSYVGSGFGTGGAANRDASLAATNFTVTPPVTQQPAPGEVRGGWWVDAQFQLIKALSQTVEFSVGIRYTYASTKTPVGGASATDTTVSFNMEKVAVGKIYSAGNATQYTAAFHAVQVPVAISFQPKKSLPVFASVGMAFGYLFSNSALTYSSASNIYFRNDNNNRPFQLPLTAAVQYRFQFKNGKELRAGPVVQYNAVGSQKIPVANSGNHLWFAGLKTTFRL